MAIYLHYLAPASTRTRPNLILFVGVPATVLRADATDENQIEAAVRQAANLRGRLDNSSRPRLKLGERRSSIVNWACRSISPAFMRWRETIGALVRRFDGFQPPHRL